MTVERVADLVRYRTIADRETARHQGMTDLQVDAALGYARDRRHIFAAHRKPPLRVANGLRAVPPGAEATTSQVPTEEDTATTTVEARGTTDPRTGCRAHDRGGSVGRAAGAQLTGQRQDGPSHVLACEQYPRAVHGGAGSLSSFAYEDTDMPSGMTCREWVRAGRPVNETAPAADATAPTPRPEGNKPMGAVQCIRPAGEVITLAAWHDERGNVADLAVHLIDSGRPDQVGDAIERPQRFTAEYHAMRAAEAEWGGDAA